MLLKFLVFYILVCMVWAALYVVRRFDAIHRETSRPDLPYHFFMAGVIWAVLISPIWVPRAIYLTIVAVIREIRKIEV